MNPTRHAAGGGPSPELRGALRSAIALLSIALGTVLAALGAISLRVARRVVTPALRVPDTMITGLDTSAQTITLARTDDTALPGRYGLFTSGTDTYLKLGSVLAEDDLTVTRKLLTHIRGDSRLAAEAAFSGWYYSRPEELHLPHRTELIPSPVGPCPAWVFPGDDASDVWVIQVHGRGSAREEGLRAVPIIRAAGAHSLLVSYRNDGDAPRSRTGTYGLGATEWRDVDAAVGYARRHGARRIVVMGWSMGGAIALQLVLNSAHRDVLAGVILDSPVVDWRVVLAYQARQMRLPAPVTALAIRSLGSELAAPITRAGHAIDFDRLDGVARAAELDLPILLMHSDDDGFVPADASHALAAARPDLVEMHTFTGARHTKLWNYDEERWSHAITTWLDSQGLSSPAAASDS